MTTEHDKGERGTLRSGNGFTAFTEFVNVDGHEFPVGGEFHITPELDSPNSPRGSVIYWQDGTVGDEGHNGATVEDVLHAALYRLRSFNATDARCRENSLAITKIEEALHWLDARTARRRSSGIEGEYVEHDQARE